MDLYGTEVFGKVRSGRAVPVGQGSYRYALVWSEAARQLGRGTDGMGSVLIGVVWCGSQGTA